MANFNSISKGTSVAKASEANNASSARKNFNSIEKSQISRTVSPSLATERADERDKMLTPSASRQAKYGLGNIDLTNRPIYKNDDGSISTVRSMSFGEDGKEILVPTIAFDKNGNPTLLTNQQAIDRYHQTGEFLGKFDTIEQANKYAQDLHKQQENYYSPKSAPNTPVAQGSFGGSRQTTYTPPTLWERLGKIVTGAAKSTGAGYVNNAGTAIRGEAERQKQQSAGEIAAWQDTIKAYQDVLADPSSTQSERETATAVITDLQRRIGAYEKAYGADGENERAANAVYGAADRLADSANADIERAQEGLGSVGKLLTGAGVAGTQMAIDMLTAPPGATLVPMFFRASGGAAQQARRNGADFDTANTVGGLTGAVEVLTEKMFDGLAGIYGGGAADDLVAQFISKHTSSPAFGRLLSYAASAAGESVEEVVSGLVDPAIQSIYNKKAYGENFDPQELLESAIIGGLLGLVGGNTMYNNVLEADAAAIEAENEAAGVGDGATERALEMLTGRTTVRSAPAAAQDAQESAQRVSRETMTPARETPQSGAQAQTFARYYEQDVRDMTGELGGKAFVERYDGTQDIAEYTAGFVRYWNAGATGRKIGSVQNTGGLNELQRYAAYYAGQNDAARSTVSEQSGVKDVAINAQRGLSSDGATARNTAAWSDELRGTVDALGRKLGVRVVVDDTFEGVSANGYYDAKTNEIHLAKDAENPVLQVVRHEATHRMQQLSPKEYRAFRDYAVRMAGEDAVEEKRQAYSRGRVELSEEEAMDEIAAETAEKLLTDETAISDFIRENRTAAQKFYDALRSVVQKVREALGADQTLAQAERLWKSAFEKADAQAQENAGSKNAAQTDGVKYSLIGKTADGIEVYETSEEVKKLPYKERMNAFLDLMRNQYRGRTAKFSTENDVYYAKFDEADLLKNVYGDKKSSPRGWRAKINTGADGEIFELVENAQYKGSDTESGKASAAHKGVTGWEYFVKTVQIDGKVYDLLANVRKKPDGEYVYSIQLNENKKKTPAPPVARAYTDANAPDGYASERVPTDVSYSSITDAAEKSKRKFSIKTDSEGRELSEQQQEYFKDSKAVDTDGRLKVMYQGGNGDFTVFDRKKSKGSNLYGRGFYFADSEAQAKQYGGTRAFYLNVTNPLTPGQNSITRQQMRDFLSAVAENEDYGLENYGYGATVDSVLESVYGKGDFEMLQDVNATAIGDLVAAAELFNEVNGTDYDGIILPTETVTFRSNQAKNVTNAAPTDNADIRFSLKAPVEETDDLIAVHNLTEKNLADALDLGGLPMPSIAVVKAKNGHSKYGPISLVFGKDTIDPDASYLNKVYGGDAYTPTAPTIDYEANSTIARKIRDKFYALERQYGRETVDALYGYANYLDDMLGRNGGARGIIEKESDNTDMMKVFLADTGKKIPSPVYTEKSTRLDDDTIALYDRIIVNIGKAALDELSKPTTPATIMDDRKKWLKKYGNQLEETYKEHLESSGTLTAEEIDNVMANTSQIGLVRAANGARKYANNGPVTVTRDYDVIASKEAIRKAVNKKAYSAWLDDLFAKAEKRKGIYNGKDIYTSSGNRKSWGALHYDYTLDNIVRAMSAGQQERGGQTMGVSAGSLQSVTTPEFGSIAEIKQNSGRLSRVDDEAYEAMKKEIDDELMGLVERIYNTTKHWSDNSFIEYDSIAEAMINAARRGGTADAIVRSFKRDGYDISKDIAQQLQGLYKRSADLPTEYFEAKPRRAVEFDEVRAVVAPKNLDPALKQRLEDEGIKVISYKTGDDADRTKKLNSIKDVRFSLRDNSPEAVAAKQQEMIEYLRGQLRRSRGVTTKKADVAKIARATAKAWDSSADVTERLQAMYDFMANGKDASGNELTWDDLWSEAKSIAGDMLGESMTRNDDLYREYADLRRTVRDTKLNVPKEMDGDLDAFGGYGEFRRGEGRSLNLSRSEGTGIYDFFQTLADSYPEYFDEALTSNPADQLARIAEVMNDLKPVYENRFAGDEQAVNYLADELINSFYDARQEAPTFADKAALDKQETVAKVKNAARDKMQTREAKLRSAYDERIAKMREMNRQKIEERMSKLREQRDSRIASLKQHYKEAEEARRNQKRDSEARTRLLNIARRLNNKKLPAVSKSLIQQYIGELDLTAKSMTGTTLERLTDLQAWYADQKETNPDFISDKNIEKALQRLAKKQIADLTAGDVESLTRVLLNIENEISTQRKLIDSQVRRDTYLAGDAAITDIENSKGSSGSKIDTFLLSETLSPIRELHRITGYVDSDPLYVVTQELADGQRKMFDYQRRANNRFKTWIEDKEFVKTIAGKDATEITITGIGKDGITSVKITPAMRMSLYLHSLNDQNLRHIAQGGITVPDITLYKKGNIVEAYNKGKTIKLTPSEVRRIAGGMRGKEHAFARAAYDYYNGQSQSEINATSERLKGYSVATVDNYFPVDTDRSFLKAEFDSIKRDGTIEGMGFLKERIDAANPIMLYDMNSVLTKSINQHSKFVGMAIPVRNFSKLWGVTTGGFNEDGSRNNFESSVQKAVKEKWGQNGYDYIEQMMADLNNVSKGQKSWGKALASARSAYAGAVLELNASVAIKQAASYPTAASVVGFKPLIKALGDTSKINTDQIARYTPLLWYRSQGYSSQELGELAQRGKSLPKALNWIQAIDVATTTKLWKAAEYYVRDTRKDLERASEAYYREVANVYNRIIEETQPNYTTMQRPALLRSDNELVRTLNMFKTQPFQNFNILYDGIENMNAKRRAYESDRGEESRKAYNEAKTAAARAITSQAVSSFVFALMQYAWDAFRGKDDKYKDEDDEYSIGAWLKAMGFNMLTNGFGMFPFGSEVLEAAEKLADEIAETFEKDPVFNATYYGVDVSVVDTINNAVEDSIDGIVQTVAAIQTAANGGEVNWESYARTMYKAVVDYAQLTGIPIDNVKKTAVAIAQQVFKATNGKYVGGYYALRLTSDPSKYGKDYYDLLYKAYKTDKKSYEEVYHLMVDDGLFSENKIKTAMEDRMKDEQKAANVKFLSQRYYSPEQQKQYDAVMSEVQSNSVWKKASEEQRRSLKDNANKLISGNGTDAENMRKKILEGKKYGLTEGEYLLYELALEITEKPNEDGKKDGNPTNDELEEAIRMLQGLSDKERSYLWSTKRDSDKNNPWK